ncbi:Leucine rich repeat-containing protein [Lachnospiraceae bacterium XBB1006]|nr:Leucine rich repeat-containing protein [Lachnospiraceae bacterium XBB1006]
MEKIKLADKRTAIVLGAFLICVIAGVVFEKVFVVSGVDAANIRWSYNTLTRTLRFETTEKSERKMQNYDACGDDEYSSGAPWWKYKNKCRHVAFGDGIVRVGELTCSGFEKLESVSFSDDVQEIAFEAFSMCKNLDSVHCSNGIKKICVDAFEESGLKSVKLNEGLKAIERGAFYSTEIKEVIFPNSVEELGEGAFMRCDYLEKVRISKGIKTIGEKVFFESYALKKVKIESKNIIEVSDAAFEEMNPEVVVEVPKEKYDEYKEMLYTHGLPETAKVVAY